MSNRHVKAIDAFKPPTNVHELQRFLGLASYFRRFIESFAIKTRPLYRLLQKSVPFDFDQGCAQAFANIKKELVAYPCYDCTIPRQKPNCTQMHVHRASVQYFYRSSLTDHGRPCVLQSPQ